MDHDRTDPIQQNWPMMRDYVLGVTRAFSDQRIDKIPCLQQRLDIERATAEARGDARPWAAKGPRFKSDRELTEFIGHEIDQTFGHPKNATAKTASRVSTETLDRIQCNKRQGLHAASRSEPDSNQSAVQAAKVALRRATIAR